ncbi:MAG: NAD(P)/FAD-dependent oxidoreductase [Armatimonadota bacterium]
MAELTYRYIIVGGGLAGAYAVNGIREHDKDGSILLLGNEPHQPYNRPPLTKGLWFGKKQIPDIFAHDEEFYPANQVDLQLDTLVTGLDADRQTISDLSGRTFRYEKLLLATGGTPRHLNIPGGELEGVCYYRYLADYERIRPQATEGKSAVVIGGGFIGSEIAAAMNMQKVDVTMVFPEDYLVNRVFPEGLGWAIQQHYQERGVTILTGDVPTSIEKEGARFVTHTKNGKQLWSDILIVGVGITPDVDLAEMAGLTIENGITVNEYLQTSNPHIYAAGDNAYFPYQALGKQMRVEHWDNALNQGKYAGRNLAGAQQQYDHLPYFYSDLFEFGYEAVGDVNTKLQTYPDWVQENKTGVIYYLQDGKVRGAMMCNVWDKVPAARELIKKGATVTPEELKGAIRPPEEQAA